MQCQVLQKNVQEALDVDVWDAGFLLPNWMLNAKAIASQYETLVTIKIILRQTKVKTSN